MGASSGKPAPDEAQNRDNQNLSMILDVQKCCACYTEDFRDSYSISKETANNSQMSASAAEHDVQVSPSRRLSSNLSMPRRIRLLPGWTQRDKANLDLAIASHPRTFSVRLCNRSNPAFMEYMERLARNVPGKSPDDCAVAYLDMISNHVVYFEAPRKAESPKQLARA